MSSFTPQERIIHLHLCIWQTLLSKAIYIAFQGTHFTFLSVLSSCFPWESNPWTCHCKRQESIYTLCTSHAPFLLPNCICNCRFARKKQVREKLPEQIKNKPIMIFHVVILGFCVFLRAVGSGVWEGRSEQPGLVCLYAGAAGRSCSVWSNGRQVYTQIHFLTLTCPLCWLSPKQPEGNLNHALLTALSLFLCYSFLISNTCCLLCIHRK